MINFIEKIKDFVRKDHSSINDNDWDKITISKKGKEEDENHLYNDAIVNISFPIKPKFSSELNCYSNDYVYRYEANYAGQKFGLVLEKYYGLAEYWGGLAYGCVETISYEGILEKIKKNPYGFLESCLKNYICELIEKQGNSLETKDCEYVIKRRFFYNNFYVIEYFADHINLINGDYFIKGWLVLFGGDMLLSHLYVTSKTKATFNADYYSVFVSSFRCHLGIKDYALGKGKFLKRKTKNIKEKIGRFIGN